MIYRYGSFLRLLPFLKRKNCTGFEIFLLFLSPLKVLQNELTYFHKTWCEYYVPGRHPIPEFHTIGSNMEDARNCVCVWGWGGGGGSDATDAYFQALKWCTVTDTGEI